MYIPTCKTQISTHGVLSFGEPFSHNVPELFPGESPDVQNGFLIAPFWDNISGDEGTSSYQIFSSDDIDTLTIENFNSVSGYINSVHGLGDFAGSWMLVANWNQVLPIDSFQSSGSDDIIEV